MIGSISLAFFAVREVGGIGALKTKLADLYGHDHTILNMVPGPEL